MEHKKHIIKLFNSGVLKLSDAEWLHKKGYSVICAAGLVVDIVQE